MEKAAGYTDKIFLPLLPKEVRDKGGTDAGTEQKEKALQ